MKQSTFEELVNILVSFARNQLPKLTKWSIEEIREGYPFHRLIFPDEAILAARQERSIVTAMGNSLYPVIAAAVAEDRLLQVETEHAIEGEVNDAACNMIEQIVTELRARRRRGVMGRIPDNEAELDDFLNSRGGGQSLRSVTADLYVGDFTGGPLFIELKTPLPNLDIAAESKRKMLYFLAIMDRKGVSGAKAFLGLTYNPYGSRERYGHSYTRKIMDMEREVLIGPELWEYIGGPGTYWELLDAIGQAKALL